MEASEAAVSAAAEEEGVLLTPSRASEHPFEADPRDHAETPFEAYRDIAPLLRFLADRLYGQAEVVHDPDGGGGEGRRRREGSSDEPTPTSARLRIYDPYYCEGSMVRYLARLGFTQVYNRNEDFYAVAAAGSVPEFDVLVTNPPFSGDHMERIVMWAERCGKPWFILMPHYIANKPFYHQHIHRCCRCSPQALLENAADGTAHQHEHIAGGPPLRPVYLGPTKQAYVFTAPVCSSDDVGERMTVSKRADEVVQALPAGFFQCIWFIQLGHEHASPVLQRWRDECQGRVEATVAIEAKLLPQLTLVRRPTPAERRWRKKQRLLATGGHSGNSELDSSGRGSESRNGIPPACKRDRSKLKDKPQTDASGRSKVKRAKKKGRASTNG